MVIKHLIIILEKIYIKMVTDHDLKKLNGRMRQLKGIKMKKKTEKENIQYQKKNYFQVSGESDARLVESRTLMNKKIKIANVTNVSLVGVKMVINQLKHLQYNSKKKGKLYNVALIPSCFVLFEY